MLTKGDAAAAAAAATAAAAAAASLISLVREVSFTNSHSLNSSFELTKHDMHK